MTYELPTVSISMINAFVCSDSRLSNPRTTQWHRTVSSPSSPFTHRNALSDRPPSFLTEQHLLGHNVFGSPTARVQKALRSSRTESNTCVTLRNHLVAGRSEPSNDTQVYFLRQEWDTRAVFWPVSHCTSWLSSYLANTARIHGELTGTIRCS